MDINDFEKALGIPEKRYGRIMVSDAMEEKLSAGFYYGAQLGRSAKKYLDQYFAILYLLKGSGSYTDHFDNRHQLYPGCLAIRHPGATHGLERTTGNDWLEFASAIPVSFYDAMVKARIIDPKVFFLNPGLSIELLDKVKRYLDSFASGERGAGYVYKAFLSLFLAFREAADHVQAPSHSDSVYHQAKIALSSNLDKRLSMPDVAAKMGLGYESFRKKFTELTGHSPQKYRILQRLNQADTLLSQTDMLIKEIAFTLGYADTPDFIKQYRKFRNISPEQYRNQTPGAPRDSM